MAARRTDSLERSRLEDIERGRSAFFLQAGHLMSNEHPSRWVLSLMAALVTGRKND
jgi:hypothetical protein